MYSVSVHYIDSKYAMLVQSGHWQCAPSHTVAHHATYIAMIRCVLHDMSHWACGLDRRTCEVICHVLMRSILIIIYKLFASR